MAWVIFDTFMEKQHDGNAVNLDTAGDDIRCMLVTSARAPVGATDTDMVTIDNTQVTGDGYDPAGHDFASQTLALNAGTVTFDAENPVWNQGASGVTDARYAIIYVYTGTPSGETPICYADLGGDVGNDTGDLTLEIDGAGILTLSD